MTFVDDGIGTHTFGYNAPTPGLAGAGQLLTLDGALANDDLVFGYDWRNRVSLRKLQTDAAAITRSEALTWDALGRLATINNASGTTGLGPFTFGYNTNLNRASSLNAPNSLVSTFQYVDNGVGGAKAQRLNSITHTRLGTTISSHTFDYDVAGRMTSWAKTASTTSSVPTFGPAASNTFGYNLSDEVTSYSSKNTATNAALDQQSWAYDADGNWLSNGSTSMSTRTHDNGNRLTNIGGAGSTVVEGVVNEYSDVQVQTSNGGNTPAKLVQDPANNGFRFRAQVPVADGLNTVTIQATDQSKNITRQKYQFTTSGQSRSFTYDANGNMLTDSNGRSFTWDAKNRLKSVTVGGNTTRWDYDYQDRRVKEYSYPANSATTALAYVNPSKLYIWDGTNLVQERNVTGATQALLTASLNAGGTIARTHHFGGFTDGATGTTKYQTTTDHLGNIREVIAASGTTPAIGTVVARYEYSTFQGPTKVYAAPVGSVDASILTIGSYYHHAASGLELALYRAYDPALGRWLSEDPIKEEGGLNLYQYGLNSPVMMVDPLGLWNTWGHNHILNTAFPQMFSDDLDKLKQASAKADGKEGQKVCNSHKHAMSAGNQDKAEAQRDYENFVRNQLQSAISYANAGHTDASIDALGQGMHAIADSFSPMHSGNASWYGMGSCRGLAGLPRHALGELWPSRSHTQQAAAALQNYYNQFLNGIK